MLIDYFAQVKADIAERRDAELKRLLAADGGSHHDLIRGRIDGLDRAMDILRDVMAQFSNPEDEPHPIVSGSTAIVGGVQYGSIDKFAKSAFKTRGRA